MEGRPPPPVAAHHRHQCARRHRFPSSAAMKTLLILPFLLAGLLSTVHLLPEAGEMAGSAVNMELPGEMGAWRMRGSLPSASTI